MKSSMLKTRLVPGLAVFCTLAVLPAAAHTQACLGSTAGHGQVALGGGVSFPESAKSYGAGAIYNASGPLAVSANFAVTVPDVEGANNVTSFGAGVAADLADVSVRVANGLSICPNVSVGHARFKQTFPVVGELEIAATQVPVGLAFGSSLPLGEGASTTVTPWVNPQFVYTRATIKAGGESESDSETSVGVAGGATVGFGQFFVGGTLSKIFEEGTKAVFGVQAGFVF